VACREAWERVPKRFRGGGVGARPRWKSTAREGTFGTPSSSIVFPKAHRIGGGNGHGEFERGTGAPLARGMACLRTVS
jgi:hypothetical protein